MIDSQPGTGESPIWNILHRVNVPIIEARLNLQNPVTLQVDSTVSSQNGTFGFDEVPAGTYVLHIEGGTGMLLRPEEVDIQPIVPWGQAYNSDRSDCGAYARKPHSSNRVGHLDGDTL